MLRGLTGAGLMAEHDRDFRRVPIEKSPTQLSPGGAKGARGLGNLGLSRDLEYANRLPPKSVPFPNTRLPSNHPLGI